MSHCVSVPEEASAESPLLDAEDLYQRLERFIWWRAHQLTSSNRNHILLETDDVASEMFLTLVECWEKYHEREDIDADAMMKIVRTSCNNKCSALIVRYYKRQSRCGDMTQISIEEAFDVAVECNVERLLESENRISVFLTKLGKKESTIVRAILTMDE